MADVAANPRPATRTKRRWLAAAGVVLLVVLLVVMLLPTLISLGIGKDLIAAKLSESVNGKVAIDDLNLSWFGNQTVKGLTITDPAGNKAADLHVQIASSLMNVILKQPGPLDVTLSGTLNGEVRPDGSISFQDLFARPSQPSTRPPSTAPARPSDPFQVDSVPRTVVHVHALTINLTNVQTRQPLSLQDMNGQVVFDPETQQAKVDLQGKTMTGSVPGSVKLAGQMSQFAQGDGTLTLRGASAKLNLSAQSIPLPISLPGIDAASHLQSLQLDVASDDLTGKIVATLNADGQTEGYNPTHIEAQATVNSVLNSQGGLSLRGGAASLNVIGSHIPFATQDYRGVIANLRGAMNSADLTKTITVGIDSDAQLEGHDPSSLTANFSIDELFSPEGRMTLARDKITGSVQGATVPTAALQPLIEHITPIVVSRDLGPLANFDATFSAGQRRSVVVNALAPPARLELKAEMGAPGEPIRGSHLLIATRAAHPELIKAFTNLNVDRPLGVQIELSSFVLPPVDPQTKKLPLSQFGATGRLTTTGRTTLTLGEEVAGEVVAATAPATAPNAAEAPPVRLAIADLAVNLDSPALGERLDLNGSAAIQGANVTFHESITNLFNAAGELAPMQALPVGKLQVTGVTASAVAPLAPANAELLAEAIGEALNATLETKVEQSNLMATFEAQAGAGRVQLTAIRKPQAISVLGAHADAMVSPRLAALLQGEPAESAIGLQEPVNLRVDVQPFELAQDSNGDYALPQEPIMAVVEAPNAVLERVPSFAEPLGLRGLTMELTAGRTASGVMITMNGDVILRRPSADQNLAGARYRGRIGIADADGAVSPEINIGMAQLSVRRLEQMLGWKRGDLSQWTGDAGDIVLQITGSGKAYRAEVHAEMPNLHSDLTADIDEQTLSLSSTHTQLTLSRRALERRLNAQTAKAKAAASADEQGGSPAAPAGRRIHVEADVPVSLAIQQFRVPLAAAAGKPFDPATVDISISLTGGPATIRSSDQISTTLSGIQGEISSKDLSKGLTFALKAKADAAIPESISPAGGERSAAANATRPASAKPGSIDIQGELLDLMSADSTLALQGAKLQMLAKLREAPTAVADAFTNMQGLLIDALGPMMNATLRADDFSLDSGTLDAQITTDHGSLEGRVRGRNQSLQVAKAKPVQAQLELTPSLRDRLLYKVHPVLADVRTTEHPIKADIPAAAVFFNDDGAIDMSKLRADISVTVGKVELDSGSSTLAVLRFFGQGEGRQVIPGEIEPIEAKIRNGILKYDKFAVHIDKYTLNYLGEVNLVKGTVDLRTEVPLKALGQSFRELEPYAENIVVPLVTRGTFGDVKTQIDPDFDLGKAALDAGFRGGIQELLKGKDGRSLLDDLLKKGGN